MSETKVQDIEYKPILRGIIDKMDAAENATRVDRMLVLMLERWFDEIPEFEADNFHKMFRQADVVDFKGGGEMDMVIWHLLHESNLFWEIAAPRDRDEDED